MSVVSAAVASFPGRARVRVRSGVSSDALQAIECWTPS